MGPFELIEQAGELFAIVLRPDRQGERKYNFPTPADSPLQLGVNYYRGGEAVPAHAHHQRQQVILENQEFIFVQRGRIEANIYALDGSLVHRCTLATGEGVLFMRGGHSLRFLDDACIVEVKQGPYSGKEADKFPLTVRS